MKLYHGSCVEVPVPTIVVADTGRDFGFGFYTTDIKDQAERWAIRRAKIAQKSGNASAKAVVSVYEIDIDAARRELKSKRFDEPSMDWLNMVVECRTKPSYHHGFDLMEGKIANDNVGETVSYVVAGVMPKELALEKLRFQQINNQIAFCSIDALKFLKFESYYTLQVT